MSAGYGFRGRPIQWNADHQAIEQERQRWVYEQISGVSEAITELSVDPEKAYHDHIEAYVKTGDEHELRWALNYVTA